MTAAATSPAVWTPPTPAGPLDAVVTVPGSKSITSRALVLAAIAESQSHIRGTPASRDTRLMAEALRALGVGLQHDGHSYTVQPAPLRGPADVDCGLAGTVMRFVPPVAALAKGPVAFDGDPRARQRPMGQMLRALRELGADIAPLADALPFELRGSGRMQGGAVTLDASSSSQFVSALLLAGARYDEGVDVRHDGKPIPSLPHVDMTVAMLRERGVVVDDTEPMRWTVLPGRVAAQDVDIEPDLSNAAPFLAAALAAGGSVTIPDWPPVTVQPGDRLRDLLAELGAEVVSGAAGLRVSGRAIHGVDVDLHDVGELTPVIAALCAIADGPSRLHGVAHLRGHESDRLAALATELTALGCDAHETDDGLEIRPRRLHAGVFHTYDDHRMAHAGVVLALAVPGLAIENVETTSKTHPDFVGAWTAMLT